MNTKHIINIQKGALFNGSGPKPLQNKRKNKLSQIKHFLCRHINFIELLPLTSDVLVNIEKGSVNIFGKVLDLRESLVKPGFMGL